MSISDASVQTSSQVDITRASSMAARRRVVFAFLLLVIVDVALRCGFHRFTSLVRSWPTRVSTWRESSDRTYHEVSVAMERAGAYYFKHARCLQRAAAVVCYLRFRGQPAQLVIGIRKIPFAAHAWVELQGAAANDPAQIRSRYAVIEVI